MFFVARWYCRPGGLGPAGAGTSDAAHWLAGGCWHRPHQDARQAGQLGGDEMEGQDGIRGAADRPFATGQATPLCAGWRGLGDWPEVERETSIGAEHQDRLAAGQRRSEATAPLLQ